MKAVITNNTGQHALILYWLKSATDMRMAQIEVPMGASVSCEVPSGKDDDQRAHVDKQCRDLGLSFKEGTT